MATQFSIWLREQSSQLYTRYLALPSLHAGILRAGAGGLLGGGGGGGTVRMARPGGGNSRGSRGRKFWWENTAEF